MEENNRTDAAEIKTVYVKEKQRTGWWKIVMMILTILIALSFGLTALFSGISAWQLSRIANYQEASYYQSPGQYGYDPYDYYDDFGGYESEIPSDSGIADDGTADEYLDDIDLGDLFEYFGISGNNGSYGTETPADGSQENGTNRRNENTETNEADSLEDWFNNLFGTGDAGSTQSEQSF